MRLGEPIRVVLADDHELIVRGVKNLLQSVEGIEVVGEEATGDDAVRCCRSLQPEVLLLDVRMPGLSTSEVVSQVQAGCPDTRILVLSAYDERDIVQTLVRQGISGYLSKAEAVGALVDALRTVVEGNKYFSPAIATQLASIVAEEPSQTPTLTAREREVLELLVQGQTDLQMGEALGISDRTIRYHLTNLFNKAAVSTRTELAMQALQQGWIISAPAG